MKQWFFPSRGFGATEGFSNPGLEMFKGEPIRAMAREICQNSLDAKRNDDHPVRIEFERCFIKTTDFPGIIEMREILKKCREFWNNDGDEKTKFFIDEAIRTISSEKFFVLRISDYNTTGLKGAFAQSEKTPWKGLVQGDAFSVKTSETAAGSFGIGKAAPFVVSKLQTVFYRTFDEENVRAAQGVTHLVSFRDENSPLGEDSIRRSTGYYGEGMKNNAFQKIDLLDRLNKRTEYGTDLFIPGFDYTATKANDWISDIIIELLENFLYAIYSGKLEITIDNRIINKKNVGGYIERFLPKTKNAAAFYEVIREDNEQVVEETMLFHNLGTLRLRLLYKPDVNKKVLVVRNSGMKISDIPSLPKSISFVGFLELQGEELNKFFRKMENPQHNKWEPKRHSNPSLAKIYKEEVEEWVRSIIGLKIKEISGDEMDIDLSSYFSSSERTGASNEDEKRENVVDTVKSVIVDQVKPTPKNFKVRDIGGTGPSQSPRMRAGIIDDVGGKSGHRHRDGQRTGATPTGRQGVENDTGEDKVYEGVHEVLVTARIIKKDAYTNRLIFVAEENISQGELEIVTVGENGKSLQLLVRSVRSIGVSTSLQNGHIVIYDVQKGKKNELEFEIFGNQNYAMGVRAYGN